MVCRENAIGVFSRLFVLQVLPDYILAIMLIILLVATANRTLRKGIKSFNKETAALQVSKQTIGIRCVCFIESSSCDIL